MLVKKVFSRSMGVCIFAVALLVEEVFCLLQLHVDQMGAAGKVFSTAVLEARLNFLRNKRSMKITTLLPMSEEIGERVRQLIQSGERFLKSSVAASGHNFDELYRTRESLLDSEFRTQLLAEVPEPFLPNLVVIVSTQALRSSLEPVLLQLRSYQPSGSQKSCGRMKIYLLKKEVRRLIALLGTMNMVNEHVRYVDLPKKKIEVTQQEVTALFEEMKATLTDYIPIDSDRVAKDSAAVVVHFLKWQLPKLEWHPVKLDTTILSVLDNLYWKHRFYRLATSEVHTTYVKDFPGLLRFTGMLHLTVVKLQRFANALSTAMHRKRDNLFWNLEKDKHQILKYLDPTRQAMQDSVVSNLKKALAKPPSAELAPLSSLPGPVRRLVEKFLPVFCDVEEMSHFFRMFTVMTTQMGYGVTSGFKKTKIVDGVQYFVAFMDEKMEKLGKTLTSNTVYELCNAIGSGANLNAIAGIRAKLDMLCKLKAAYDVPLDTEKNMVPDERENSFYSSFIENFGLDGDLRTMIPDRGAIPDMMRNLFRNYGKDLFKHHLIVLYGFKYGIQVPS